MWQRVRCESKCARAERAGTAGAPRQRLAQVPLCSSMLLQNDYRIIRPAVGARKRWHKRCRGAPARSGTRATRVSSTRRCSQPPSCLEMWRASISSAEPGRAKLSSRATGVHARAAGSSCSPLATPVGRAPLAEPSSASPPSRAIRIQNGTCKIVTPPCVAGPKQ